MHTCLLPACMRQASGSRLPCDPPLSPSHMHARVHVPVSAHTYVKPQRSRAFRDGRWPPAAHMHEPSGAATSRRLQSSRVARNDGGADIALHNACLKRSAAIVQPEAASAIPHHYRLQQGHKQTLQQRPLSPNAPHNSCACYCCSCSCSAGRPCAAARIRSSAFLYAGAVGGCTGSSAGAAPASSA